MRFCIECTRLTDDDGKGIQASDPARVSYRFVEAPKAADAITSVVPEIGNEILGRIHSVADIQALATVRRGRSAVALHAFPAEEAEWRKGTPSS